MEQTGRGYHEALISDVEPGERYFFRLPENKERADLASRSQPDGVHGPSQVVAQGFAWNDKGWRGLALEDYIIYELHVGLFTADGTFKAIIAQLDDLIELGITAIELMPVGQFPGRRNWGYDGVFPFAAQNSYGGPEGLKELVDACHRRARGCVGRRLQPPRPGRKLLHRLRSLLHGPISDTLGARDQFRRAGER
jgi:maltooligosyltrehalose trehalohydrolase